MLPLGYINQKPHGYREAAKKTFFYGGLSTMKGGGGVKSCPLRKKTLFLNVFFLFKFVTILLSPKQREGGGG